MKPLRLILPITLFILSGVLAWVGGVTTNETFKAWCGFSSFTTLISSVILIYWALGGFDD